ncbi:MAG TPA: hypothetical protein VFU31_24785 [Candidatus Binatia bacterium]|nr:hypothetical protein [Candidatus Binatia bacterium]
MKSDPMVTLVRAAILEALDGKPWLFWDEDEDLANAQRVDFADRVCAWVTRSFPSNPETDCACPRCDGAGAVLVEFVRAKIF